MRWEGLESLLSKFTGIERSSSLELSSHTLSKEEGRDWPLTVDGFDLFLVCWMGSRCFETDWLKIGVDPIGRD